MKCLKLRKLKKEYKSLFETYSPEDEGERTLLIDELGQLADKYPIPLTTSRRDIDKLRLRIEEFIQRETINLYTLLGIIVAIVAVIAAALIAWWTKQGS